MITINKYIMIVTVLFLNLFTVYNPYILKKSGGGTATWGVYSSYNSPPPNKGEKKIYYFK